MDTKLPNTDPGKRKRLQFFLLLTLASGLPAWLSSYSAYLHNPFIAGFPILLCAIAAGWLSWTTRYSYWSLLGFTFAAHTLAFMGKVTIDCIADPSNHNLLPFEILMYLIIDFVLFSIVILLTRSLKK